MLTPEQEKEIRTNFNLSPEQWEQIPPRAREALSGVKVVEVEKVFNGGEWIPIEKELPDGSCTVALTNDPKRVRNLFRYVRIGFLDYEEDGRPVWDEETRGSSMSPTHWLPFPEVGGHSVSEEEDDD